VKDITSPYTLSRRPNLAPQKEAKLTFGQLLKPENIMEETFAKIAEFDTWFHEEAIKIGGRQVLVPG
jgi:hypothetical protein